MDQETERPEPSDDSLYAAWFAARSTQERKSAWDDLDRRYRTKLLAHCVRVLGNTPDAADCVSEVFLQLMKKRRRIQANFRAYFWKVARGYAYRAKRKRNPQASIGEPIDDRRPDGEPIRNELKQALASCLGKLPPDERDFVLLHACEGLTLAEARKAVRWKRAVSTCLDRFRKAIEKLRACLKKSGFSTENGEDLRLY